MERNVTGHPEVGPVAHETLQLGVGPVGSDVLVSAQAGKRLVAHWIWTSSKVKDGLEAIESIGRRVVETDEDVGSDAGGRETGVT